MILMKINVGLQGGDDATTSSILNSLCYRNGKSQTIDDLNMLFISFGIIIIHKF